MNTSSISAQIWQKHSEMLKTFICGKVNGEDRCHDILHNVFLKLTNNEDRIKVIAQPASYIIKIAQNAIIDYYRSQKKILSQLQKGETIPIETLPDIQLADCCLLSFIKKLPPTYSEAIIFTDLDGLSQKALAKKLNISYTGAKSRVQRARQMLKKEILKCCQYEFDKYGNIISCCKRSNTDSGCN
jgi:RNA polymerase sigma-70 factor (ECF subfamily)